MEFYKETNFKKTDIGEIPEDWDAVGIGEIIRNKGIYYGITAKATGKETKLRILRTTDIKNYCTDWDTLPFCKITEKRNDLTKYSLKKGDLIVARAGTTGMSVLIDRDLENVVFGSYLIKIKLKSGLLPKFVHYFFQSNLYWKHITSGQAGSTLKNIKLPTLKSLNIPLPKKTQEQQKIISILSSIDEGIRKTNAIIKKTQELKKGLMQELLTKGIGHKEFKKTEIGEIPEDWNVAPLGKVAEIRCGKPKCNIAIKEIAFIPMELISDDGIYPTFELRSFKKISSHTYCEAGDVLLAKITPSLENGKQCIVPENIPNGFALATTEVFPIICKGINKMFLFYLLKYPKFRKQLENSMSATTGRLRLPRGAVIGLIVPLPQSGLEQQKIASILSDVDEKIEKEKQTKEQLEKLKRGLMQILLAGKVRVRVG